MRNVTFYNIKKITLDFFVKVNTMFALDYVIETQLQQIVYFVYQK